MYFAVPPWFLDPRISQDARDCAKIIALRETNREIQDLRRVVLRNPVD